MIHDAIEWEPDPPPPKETIPKAIKEHFQKGLGLLRRQTDEELQVAVENTARRERQVIREFVIHLKEAAETEAEVTALKAVLGFLAHREAPKNAAARKRMGVRKGKGKKL